MGKMMLPHDVSYFETSKTELVDMGGGKSMTILLALDSATMEV